MESVILEEVIEEIIDEESVRNVEQEWEGIRLQPIAMSIFKEAS